MDRTPPQIRVSIVIVEISERVARKIRENHQVTPEEVREAVVMTRLDRSGWDFDDERGWRLLASGTTYWGRELNAVLYPADDDGRWRLGTAMWRYD